MLQNKTSVQITSILEKLFEDNYNTKPEKIEPLPVSGSDRCYYRLSAGSLSAIGTYNDNVAENNTYFYATELFKKHHINVPEVFKINKDRKAYLQQDLGGVSLYNLLQKEGLSDRVQKLYRKAVADLAKIQWEAGRDTDFRQCYGAKQFDEKAIMADLLYFKYYFADIQDIPYDRNLLNNEMEQLSKDLGRVLPQTLMYRDFQSRNIMVKDGELFYIDFQGFMQGPPQYDLASLLWQARAALPGAWKDDLQNSYFSALNELNIARVNEVHFRRGYVQFVLVRLLQVLGAYGFRGLLKHKTYFITSIGPALKNLNSFLEDHPQTPSYPELRLLLEKISSREMQRKYSVVDESVKPRLNVQITSFSYKNGIPKSNNAYGGGYAFDCRGLLNPGRFNAYKFLTGNDEPVIQFLERETKMPDFMNAVYALVAIHVEDYIERGFEQLSVAFGCTGGQHRSVYAANQLAEYLKTRYNLETSVAHLNEKKWVLRDEGETNRE